MSHEPILNPGDWPLETSYTKNCKDCGQRFFGPKRAPQCWHCTSEEMQKMWWDTHK